MKNIRNIRFLLCALALITQGCVRDGLNECPPSVRYAISFEYLLHSSLDANNNPINLFAEEVEKMYVYVFDHETGICACADTTLTGPFEAGDIYTLPLITGVYDIIIWGWGRNTGDPDLRRSTGVIPAVVVPGETKIDNVRFILNELNNSSKDSVSGKIERTFFGEISNNDIPPFVSRIDTVSLMNLSRKIRVIIPDIENDAENFPNWRNNVKITIEGDNGAYFFKTASGAGAPTIDPLNGRVIYSPYETYYTDQILKDDPIFSTGFDQEDDHVGLVVDISTLRLVLEDTDMKILIRWNDGTKNRSITLPLLELITRHPDYAWYSSSSSIQKALDREDRWEIVFKMTDTVITVATNILEWHVIKQDVIIGV
ncbi:MAG: FimB/Mfa2 family fimbrial subunit [Tannerella sp.]|nr:FimB/Mfa2 family fimbrial subunit [Tannerella sp.]